MLYQISWWPALHIIFHRHNIFVWQKLRYNHFKVFFSENENNDVDKIISSDITDRTAI